MYIHRFRTCEKHPVDQGYLIGTTLETKTNRSKNIQKALDLYKHNLGRPIVAKERNTNTVYLVYANPYVDSIDATNPIFKPPYEIKIIDRKANGTSVVIKDNQILSEAFCGVQDESGKWKYNYNKIVDLSDNTDPKYIEKVIEEERQLINNEN